MTLTAWRIFKAKHLSTAFSGEGARIGGGRWNSVGTPVVYTSENRSLAMLETLAHLQQSAALSSFLMVEISFSDSLVEAVEPAKLPANWRSMTPIPECASIGDNWVRRNSSAVLKVPSVLVDGESNFLLNPRHRDFASIQIGLPSPALIDPRLRP